ncbi:hypothetical protein EMA8858_03690 [Emticicia aquatica]|uniref:Uncharacterized protein n=1 Tax=Emticicia aquatica TaxID=1681835 RepID=A0ABM9AVV0_9BACT|nr:hypothetical protein EMA8858_03690 [Emticicia aquatica]
MLAFNTEHAITIKYALQNNFVYRETQITGCKHGIKYF